MTKGQPALPRLKNRDIVRAIVKVLERYEKQEQNVIDFMRCQL